MTEHPQDEANDDHFVAFTGDPASAARLRANLVTLAEDHPNTGIASIVHEVLGGRRPIRDLADDPQFSEMIEIGVDDYRNYTASLTPELRAEMVANAKETASS